MGHRVYVETTIVSYLTSRPSRDLVVAAHQRITQDWWGVCSSCYELCASELVLDEAADGDPAAAHERLSLLRPMLMLETKTEAYELAEALLRVHALPSKAANDALHIAIAATNSVPYLLTWNCRHMANATMRPLIERACKVKDVIAPIICTPEELMESEP